jgi:tetraacyldisaccharide 4'-kinase
VSSLGSQLFKIGLVIRNAAYRLGLKQSVFLPGARVISVGNLSVGGTGKSPLVERLVVEGISRGQKVLVLSRGYGRKSTEDIYVQTGPQSISVETIGDEPAALKARVPRVSLFISKDRARRASERWQEVQAPIVLADDAFQHWALSRDLDIVTIDASEPFPAELLPMGRWREPVAALGRADVVVITRSNEAKEPIAALRDRVEAELNRSTLSVPWRKSAPPKKRKVFLTEHFPVTLSRQKELIGIESLRGRKVFLLSGIGKPASFRNTCERLGAQVVGELSFRDHAWLGPEDLKQVTKQFLASEAEWLVTTEKDSQRWQGLKFPVEPYVVRVRIRFLDRESLAPSPETEHEFLQLVMPKILGGEH